LQAPTVPKFVPVRVRAVPTLTLLFGVKVIFGTVVKVAAALSPKLPVTVTAAEAALFPAPATTMEAVIEPDPDTEHEEELMKTAGVIVQPVSPELNPLPEIEIVSPPLPLFDESVMVGLVTVNPAVTVVCTTNAFYIVTAYGPNAAVFLTTKLPVRVPSVAMLQLAGFAPPAKRPFGVEVVLTMHAVGTPAL